MKRQVASWSTCEYILSRAAVTLTQPSPDAVNMNTRCCEQRLQGVKPPQGMLQQLLHLSETPPPVLTVLPALFFMGGGWGGYESCHVVHMPDPLPTSLRHKYQQKNLQVFQSMKIFVESTCMWRNARYKCLLLLPTSQPEVH